MRRNKVRINVTREQAAQLRQQILANLGLSEDQRSREVGHLLAVPANGSHVTLYCEGEFVGSVFLGVPSVKEKGER